jgi:regulator of replication initiation timing
VFKFGRLAGFQIQYVLFVKILLKWFYIEEIYFNIMTLEDKYKNAMLLHSDDLYGVIKTFSGDDVIKLASKSPSFLSAKPEAIPFALNSSQSKATMKKLVKNKDCGNNTGLEIAQSFIITDFYNFDVQYGDFLTKVLGSEKSFINPLDKQKFGLFCTKEISKRLNSYEKKVKEFNYAELRREVISSKGSEEFYKNLWALSTSDFWIHHYFMIEVSGRSHLIIKEEQQTLLDCIKFHGEEIDRLNNLKVSNDDYVSKLEDQIKDISRKHKDLRNEFGYLQKNYSSLSRENETLAEGNSKLKSMLGKVDELEKEKVVMNLRSRVKELEEQREFYDLEKEELEGKIHESITQKQKLESENLKLKAKVKGLKKPRFETEVEKEMEKTLEDRFEDAGLDYELIDAIVVGGSRNFQFIAGNHIPSQYFKKNAERVLRDKSKIKDFEKIAKFLVSQNVLTKTPDDNDVYSVNPKVNEVRSTLLREFLSDLMEQKV